MTPYLLVDGMRVVAAEVERPWVRFTLTLPASEIRLISGSARPRDVKESQDTRRLGVLLRQLRWTQGDATADTPIQSGSFIDGFHQQEIHEDDGEPVRWTTGNAAIPPAAFPGWEGEVVLHLCLGEWQGSDGLTSLGEDAALLSGFESLGEDCELGLVQRHYALEPPLSLFRWGGAPFEKLIEGLETRFADVDRPDTAEIVWAEEQYFLRTPLVTMHSGCKVRQDAEGEAELLRCGLGTLRVLRRKLLRDIAAASRIFVYKALRPEFAPEDMRRLHSALSGIGPAQLLCVRKAGQGQPAGVVEKLQDGLYAGYLEKFLIQDNGPHEPWIDLCFQAAILVQQDRRARAS